MEPPPFVLFVSFNNGDGECACLSFSDGTMSEPFSNVKEGLRELLSALEADKVTFLQGEMLEKIIELHPFTNADSAPVGHTPRSILVRDGRMEDGEDGGVFQGPPEHFGYAIR